MEPVNTDEVKMVQNSEAVRSKEYYSTSAPPPPPITGQLALSLLLLGRFHHATFITPLSSDRFHHATHQWNSSCPTNHLTSWINKQFQKWLHYTRLHNSSSHDLNRIVQFKMASTHSRNPISPLSHFSSVLISDHCYNGDLPIVLEGYAVGGGGGGEGTAFETQ